MKKELPYFRIENSYGGNQSWFRDPMMNLGGCAAATACDSAIYLATYCQRENCCPFDVKELNKETYIRFASQMKPYLSPRIGGIRTIDIFMDGFQKYLMGVGATGITFEGLQGTEPLETVKSAIRTQIDQGMPVPYLLLKHKGANFRDYTWHWFLLAGYEEYKDDFFVKTVTYGGYRWFSLQELWETGYPEKGGLVKIRISPDAYIVLTQDTDAIAN